MMFYWLYMNFKVLKYRIGSVQKQSIWGIVAQSLIITSENHIPLLWSGGGGNTNSSKATSVFFAHKQFRWKTQIQASRLAALEASAQLQVNHPVGIPETELMSIYTFTWPSAWLCYTSKVAWSIRTSSAQSFVHLSSELLKYLIHYEA